MRTSGTTGRLWLQDLTGQLENNEQITSTGGSPPTADCNNASVSVKHRLSARYHQIKWGTDYDDEKFSVNWITYNFDYEGEY